MNTNLNDLLTNVTEFLRSEAKTETITGEQFQLGEFSCVPVMSIGMGFGTMGGEGKGKGTSKGENEGEGEGGGGGAGAGMGINPMGFLVSRGEQISFIPTKNNAGLSSVFEKVPDILEKYFQKSDGKKS